MTAPVWMASPPEVHSTLLSAGPGPGPLLAAAAAWNALNAEYVTAADELTALLAAVQSGAWQGPAVQAYAAANAPYLAWLIEAGLNSAVSAVRLETAATAYAAALAAMPTLAELAANHATHAVLIATNFFGVNTIPIAVNEADYARMWIQAATVMGGYQAVAAAAVASAPQATPAPRIVKANAAEASLPPDTQDRVSAWLQQIGYTDFYDNVLQPLITALQNNPFFQAVFSGFDPWLTTTGNPLIYLNPFNVAFALGYPMDIGSYVAYLSQTFAFIGVDLSAAFASGNPGTIGLTLLFTAVEAVGTVITDTIALLKTLLEQAVLIPMLLPLLAAPLVPIGAVTPSVLGGLAGLAGLHAVPAVVPPAVAPPVALALSPAPAPAAPVPAPAPVPAAAPAAAPAPPPGPAPPPSFAGPEAFGYLVGGMGMDSRLAARTGAKQRTPDPAFTAAPAAAEAVAEQSRARRSRRAKATMPGRGFEYMDLEPEPEQAPTRGAGPLGFTGTAPPDVATTPVGLTALAEDTSGDRAPMMPHSWGA